jgi:hypothetical protein
MNESNERLSTADLVARPGNGERGDDTSETRPRADAANVQMKRGEREELRNGADRSQRSDNAATRDMTQISDDIELVSADEARGYQERWSAIQGNFVDEPKSSVEGADSLVAEVIQSLAKRFADERQKLEQQWHSGSDVSTEDLRQAMQHYRSFFKRLLAA